MDFKLLRFLYLAVLSDNEREIHHQTPTQEPKNISIDSQQVLNYSSIPNAVATNEADQASQDPSLSSTETLLRNIQGLLKVAADNARQQERQLSYEKGTFARIKLCLKFQNLIFHPIRP
jgi:hypothetical protein